MNFKTYDPDDLSIRDRHQMLIGAIGPRPIALTTSIDKNNNLNLAPFSFHNILSSNPPIVGISPALSGRTGQSKDTLKNIIETKKFTVSIVSYSMVNQMNLCAVEFDSNINEFEVSGFSEFQTSSSIPGVKESPVILECELSDYIKLGDKPASGNLILGKISKIHLNDLIVDDQNNIDPHKIDQVGRLGLNWYSRANSDLFELGTPRYKPMGYSNIPNFIKSHKKFNNDLINKLAYHDSSIETESSILTKDVSEDELVDKCIDLIIKNDTKSAWQIIKLIDKSFYE
ncbi:MAG: flavin reductase [Candidatus Marinimicrobia bacterium]|nr:flavin reductase [Candidatus Neomarinimicrobiota bacterium]|tara:strand:- start:262 stop:1119 length:858 start_codon:yes stop_codon:yes gene_type:complete